MASREYRPPEATLDLSRSRPRLDEELTLRVTGLRAGTQVTIEVYERHGEDCYASSARFETDEDGVVDTTRDAPVAGDYDGVRPMGLFQFQTELPDLDPGDVGLYDGSDVDGEIGDGEDGDDEDGDAGDGDALTFPGRVRATVAGVVVGSATFERVIRPAGVTKTDVEHPDLVADLYVPEGDGPHPGVVWFGGSEGGRPWSLPASLLAARGYAVLGLAYFGTDDLPTNLVDVPVEYFETAIEWFGDHDAVRTEPMGVMSVSRGSEIALHLGANRPEIRTVVVRAPSDVRYGGIYTGKPDEWGPPGAAWTRDGEALPYVPVESSPVDVFRWLWAGIRGRAVEIDHTYVDGREAADEATVDAATIPVEETGGPILLLSGEDDRQWPSTEMAANVVDRLSAADYDHRFEHHSYPDAGHAIGVPYAPVTGRETSPLFLGIEMANGGTADGYAEADADSWPRVLDVLADGLR